MPGLCRRPDQNGVGGGKPAHHRLCAQPYRPIVEPLPEPQLAQESDLTWREAPKSAFYCRLAGFGPEAGLRWGLVHKPSGIAMQESGDFPTALVALWGTAHVVSPEVFIRIDLPAGETLTWSRTFTFNAA